MTIAGNNKMPVVLVGSFRQIAVCELPIPRYKSAGGPDFCLTMGQRPGRAVLVAICRMTSQSIAVVVPVYNRATSMLPTLESIAAQTVPPQRLVVVDDGSRDDSAEAVERWVAER